MSFSLPVVERFHSLQGEGMHYGKSAFFIRLGGCKVGCQWCDTKESWSFNAHKHIKVSELSKESLIAQKNGAGFVVITGGEPLLHIKFWEFMDMIHEQQTYEGSLIVNSNMIHHKGQVERFIESSKFLWEGTGDNYDMEKALKESSVEVNIIELLKYIQAQKAIWTKQSLQEMVLLEVYGKTT